MRKLHPNIELFLIFQPHLFSRTQDLENEFCNVLESVDKLALLDIYAAREEPISGVSSINLLQKIEGIPLSEIENRMQEDNVLPLRLGTGETIGFISTDYAEDPSLSPDILLENLTVKATATMALNSVLESNGVDPETIDYVIGSGEEAIGTQICSRKRVKGSSRSSGLYAINGC